MRFLEDKEKTKGLKIMARNIYGSSLFVNWAWHLYWSANYYYLLAPEHFFYFFMLFWIIKDDIILFNWLCN